MCDEYISSDSDELDEYKLFCFKGKVRFIQHNREINGKRFANIYSDSWEKINVMYGYPHFECKNLPENRNEMSEAAEKLASPFDFVRVDLYNVDGRIIFSELTFHPGGGLVEFIPSKYDEDFGRFF